MIKISLYNRTGLRWKSQVKVHLCEAGYLGDFSIVVMWVWEQHTAVLMVNHTLILIIGKAYQHSWLISNEREGVAVVHLYLFVKHTMWFYGYYFILYLMSSGTLNMGYMELPSLEWPWLCIWRNSYCTNCTIHGNARLDKVLNITAENFVSLGSVSKFCERGRNKHTRKYMVYCKLKETRSLGLYQHVKLNNIEN